MWRTAGGKALRFKQIGSTAVTVNFITSDEDSKHLLVASSDGSVTLWSTDSFLPVYKMKLSGVAYKPTFFSRSRFFLYLDSEIKLFSIRDLYEGWMDCNSEPVSLKQLSYGLILAGGIRINDLD